MVQKVITELVCDLTGEPAEETVRFGLDGVDYEIDLSGNHAGVLRDVMADYVDHGRKVTGKANATTPAQWQRAVA